MSGMADVAMNMTDYDEARRTFRLDVPEQFNYTRDVVDAWAEREPSRLALLAVGPTGGNPRRFTFADVSSLSNRAATFLLSQGVTKGDRIFVMLPRIPEWYWLLLGAFKIGAVPMPGTVQLTAKDIDSRINVAEASVVVT